MMGLGLRRRSYIAWRWLLHRLQPVRWSIKPSDLTEKKICLLVTFTSTGTLARHTLALCEAWHLRGFKVILIVAMERPEEFRHDVTTTPFLEGLLPRANIGYDFGSWVYGLHVTPGIRRASLLAMTNDSVYGPLDSFDVMLSRVAISRADIVGVTDSHERLHHLQSFLVFYKRAALASITFRRFWSRIPTGGRGDAIVQGELRLLSAMLREGLEVDVLFPCDPSFTGNPTLGLWRELVDRGFPFVKIELLRDNPTAADLDGWEKALRDRGYDPDLVARDLGSKYDGSAAARTASPQMASRR